MVLYKLKLKYISIDIGFIVVSFLLLAKISKDIYASKYIDKINLRI